MKKVVILLLIIVAGFFGYRYYTEHNQTKSVIEVYHEEIQTSMKKMEMFFKKSKETLASKSEMTTHEQLISELEPQLKAVETDMAMIATTDEVMKKAHEKLLNKVRKSEAELEKANKQSPKKAKKVLEKQVEKLQKEYSKFTTTLQEQDNKYNTQNAEHPEETEKPNEYQHLDDALDNAEHGNKPNN